MKVYFSHTGVNNYAPELEVDCSGTFLALIDIINRTDGYSEIKNRVINNNKIASSARIFINVSQSSEKIKGRESCYSYKFYEKEDTEEITDMNKQIIEDIQNVLITIFDAQSLLKMVNASLAEQPTNRQFYFQDVMGKQKSKDYKATIDHINFDYDVKKEDIYGFKNGETTLESLQFKNGEEPTIQFSGDGFIKSKSKILAEDLVEAIREIWELPQGVGTLRLFQEDSLFFIMAKLMGIGYPKENQLLLSMPTGGGKTEAFMIPLLTRIYYKKLVTLTVKGIQSIVIYPTNALANDQAMRFVELIYKINCRLTERDVPVSRHISIGILSGDTPNRSKDLATESLIRICPKCGKADVWDTKDNKMICKNLLSNGKPCGTNLSSFCRLTKEDIVNDPPDILITNPDMINYALHSPKYMPIFKNQIESIVFDEVHVYQGILGCHVSHLLRRLEELMAKKPLYIGMSATIGNAMELASLLFDEELENIKYIKNENNKYITDKIIKSRQHVLITPYYMGNRSNKTGGTRERYVTAMTVAGTLAMFIGHLITDSHFRKSIIFTNYRADADKLARDLRERERLDTKEYFDEIIYDIEKKLSLTQEEIDICLYMDRWIHEILENNNTINTQMNVGWNRGGLEKEERIRSIHSFSRNSLLGEDGIDDATPIDIMVATKTMEVGIDIGDVTTVINSSAPFTTNEYVQRVGRAGRKKDSLAITVINPESAIDCYMRNHFDNYVYAKEADFEDAPIIVNNEIIIEKHIKARIVDFYTNKLLQIDPNTDFMHVTIGDIVDRIPIIKNGVRMIIGDGVAALKVEEYADSLYDEIFHRSINGETYAERFIAFLKKEEKIIDTEPCEVTGDFLREIIHTVIREINKHLQSNAKVEKWEKSRFLVGRDNKAAMEELTPSLRGAGANVALYVNESENSVDVVPRATAFNSMPISNEYAISTTLSGVSSFRIKDDKGESDKDSEKEIKKKIVNNRQAIDYFYSKLDDFPYSDDEDEIPMEVATGLNVMVPRKLRVSYFPSRFYCVNCQRGLIPDEDYVEKSDGVYCKKCKKKAVQLHKVYMCADDSCGQLYDPPIPKMCINPDCPSVKAAYVIFKKNGNSFKNPQEIRDLFKFRLTNDMEWVCKKCGARINYAQYYRMRDENPAVGIQRILGDFSSLDKSNPDYIAKTARSFPETPIDREHQNIPVFKCKVCPSRKMKPVSVPAVRTVSYNYIGNTSRNGRQVLLCDAFEADNMTVEFYKGYVIQLAQEYVRRFSSGTRDNTTYTLKTEKIFDQQYWANFYESHLAWISFGNKLKKFINERHYTCDGDCTRCIKFDNLDLGKMMKPKRVIEDYNYDSTKQKPKKPDQRGKYCKNALNYECSRQYCQLEDGTDLCSDFKTEEFLQFIIVHTVKHGILWALPKYAGVNISEVKGEIYPNDKVNGHDLVLIDSNEGGSGAILLIKKHWDKIWSFANDVIMDTCNNQANIILPHSCSRNNADLCPFITVEYLEYLKKF